MKKYTNDFFGLALYYRELNKHTLGYSLMCRSNEIADYVFSDMKEFFEIIFINDIIYDQESL